MAGNPPEHRPKASQGILWRCASSVTQGARRGASTFTWWAFCHETKANDVAAPTLIFMARPTDRRISMPERLGRQVYQVVDLLLLDDHWQVLVACLGWR